MGADMDPSTREKAARTLHLKHPDGRTILVEGGPYHGRVYIDGEEAMVEREMLYRDGGTRVLRLAGGSVLTLRNKLIAGGGRDTRKLLDGVELTEED